MTAGRRLFLTGATGYIGEQLHRLALEQGYEIIALGRTKPRLSAHHLAYEVGNMPELEHLQPGDRLVHLAMAPVTEKNFAACLEAERNFLRAAAERGVRLIYISSMVAGEKAGSDYGAFKYALEREVQRLKGTILRPGMVYGGKRRGLYGKMANFMERFCVLPRFHPSPNVQVIHVRELAAAILSACDSLPEGIVTLAHPEAMKLNDFLRHIAPKKCVTVPVPLFLVKATAWSARLNSLLAAKAVDTRADLKRLGVEISSMQEALRRDE